MTDLGDHSGFYVDPAQKADRFRRYQRDAF
jgi:hypothetical protein